MTDISTDATPKTTPAAKAAAGDHANGTPLSSNKTFWAGVGIGSAALVAALMYARRPKKKK